MKKVFVVSKTHLDLGFTNYAAVIKETYLNDFIPNAIALAKQVNRDGRRNFVWTTGSWIIKEALEKGTPEQQKNLREAIERGDIVAHALPFTTHTELLDTDTLDYGLSIVDRIDALRGRKTIAAKMTDVPGHTRGLVKLLAKHGIRFLHIGVNGASAVPKVPECFLWKSGDSEVVVVYSGDYGGAFQSDLLDEILYFDHTHDNSGAPEPEKILSKINSLRKQYPDYEVAAGTLDDFAEVIWEKREKLPVVEEEIGDTWIHGSATDPYKSAALRELITLKNKWLADGSLQRDSEEYIGLADNLLCVAEHTCGMDVKMYFADYEHYLKKDFQAARAKDTIAVRNPFAGFPQNFLVFASRLLGIYKKSSYHAFEKSWAEQRGYITAAVAALSPGHRAEAEQHLRALRPKTPAAFTPNGDAFAPVSCGKWAMQLNKNGGIGVLSFDGDAVIRKNAAPILEYRSFAYSDYQFWLEHYSRDLKQNFSWAYGDFARPLLQKVSGKYPTGRFPFTVQTAAAVQAEDSVQLFVNLVCERKLSEELGAPRLVQLVYTLRETGLTLDVSWYQKDANRLTEAVYLHMYPTGGKVTFDKLGDVIDPMKVVSKGGRNLHAVWAANVETEKGKYKIYNRHSPIVSPGRGKILEFDDQLEHIEQDGMTFVLYNNVWGTNFPLWYEENAAFRFEITNAVCPDAQKETEV